MAAKKYIILFLLCTVSFFVFADEQKQLYACSIKRGDGLDYISLIEQKDDIGIFYSLRTYSLRDSTNISNGYIIVCDNLDALKELLVSLESNKLYDRYDEQLDYIIQSNENFIYNKKEIKIDNGENKSIIYNDLFYTLKISE